MGKTRSCMSSSNSVLYECLDTHVMMNKSIKLTPLLYSESLPTECRVQESGNRFDLFTKSSGKEKIGKNPGLL